MKYGYFDDLNREYVINTPYTPYPWINYLGSDDYFVLMSNTSGGYSFYKDARDRRITRYRYNNVPIDNEGRYFFIKENDVVWNIGVKPTKTKLDSYEVRHGMGYTKFHAKKNGLIAKQLSFVPKHFNGEIHQISLKNDTDSFKSVELFSYVEWAFWNALDDQTNFQRNFSIGEVEIEGSTIYHKTEYRERRNHYAFFHVNHKIDGFDTDRESFIGLYNDLSHPEVVYDGKSKQSIADGWAPVGSHHINIKLQPGEQKDLIFMIGYVENDKGNKFESDKVIKKTKAKEMMKSFETTQQVEVAFNALNQFWKDTLSNYQIKSNDEKLNRMVNIWNQYQTMTTFNLSRSASYFESGVGRGMGFRDSNQDLLGFMHMDIVKTRQRLLDLAATLLIDGGAYHQYSPLTKKGNTELGSGFNDDPSWLILACVQYIKESGDYTILDEVIMYESNPKLKGTMLEHLEKAFYKTANNLGPHGLPLIGRADWNDCLNLNCFSDEPGESFQTVQNKGDGLTAESIFIAGLFVYVGKKYSNLLSKINEMDKKIKVDHRVSLMIQSVEKHGFDGQWFLRAYDAFGQKVGSNENDEGKIFIEPQGMCVMAGIGIDNGMAKKALLSAKKYLDTPYGMVLNYPAYSKYQLKLGEISSYPEGYKENGGIFCHNNPWVACAEATMGNGNRAFEIYSKIAPAYLEDISNIHRTEPYVYSQMIAGKEAKRHGEAKNSWLTGTSAWNFVAISQYILGIHPDFDGLMIKPVLPDSITTLEIIRKFRKNTYHIKVLKTGNYKLYMDDMELEGCIVPYKEVGEHINITVHV